jgi:hypothetical protein
MVGAYYGASHGVNLYDIANINPTGGGGLYLGDTANPSNRLNLQYSNMNYRSDGGYSHYESLNLRFAATNLWSKGLSLTMNYTWSHALDNLSSTFSDGAGQNYSAAYQLGYLDAFNPKLNFGNADFDIRHRFILSGSWEVPWLKNSSNKLLRAVVGGWGLGSILNIRTGAPFTIYDCNNSNDTGCPLYITPSQVPTTGSAVATSGSNYQGPNTFNYIALPAAKDGTVANQGDSLGFPVCSGLGHIGCKYTTSGLPYPERNQYFGPGFWNLDMNFFKNFRITERVTMQFRAEMYNIFNHVNQYIQYLNLDVSSMSAPYITTEKGGIYGFAGQPNDERRNVQLGLRLTF